MGKIQCTTTIPADPAKVWSVMSSPATYEQWMTIHTKWKGDVPEAWSTGDRADEVVTMLGMANTISWTATNVDAPTSLTISGTGTAVPSTRQAMRAPWRAK